MLSVWGRLGSRRRESGQVVVLFAFLIPVIFALAAIVMDVGNWWVHKRHLQTQVDAAALSPARQFTGCFDTQAWDSTNTLIKEHSLGYAGDELRPGVLGSNTSTTTNLQVQEPQDVRIALNSTAYWQQGDPTDGSTLDNTMDRNLNGDKRFCDEKYIDVKATDDEPPLLWGLIPVHPSPKSHARAALFWEEGAKGILPFAVPEVVPGAVAAIFVDEGPGPSAGSVLGSNFLSPTTLGPSDFSLYTNAAAGTFTVQDGLRNIGVVILLSRADITNPDITGSTIGTICTQTGVRCYSGGGATSGLAYVNVYNSGSSTPALRRTNVTPVTCNMGVNYSAYFSRTGDCVVNVESTIDFGGLLNPQVQVYDNANCSGSGDDMTSGGPDPTQQTQWNGQVTLPEPGPSTGQIPISLAWKAQGTGPFECFGLQAARPYVMNGKSGPVEYLELSASGQPNPYSIPKDVGSVTYGVTVGVRPPLRQGTLGGKPVLIRYATENDPSLTQSIDCDVDNYPYPAPYNNLPADVAEIAYGCVTPYKINSTLDCSTYSLGDLPPAAPPTTNWDNAPDCAQSKNGQVASLRKGLVERLTLPDGTCAPNNWPNPPGTPISQTDLDNWLMNLGSDPRLVTLVVTEFAAFAGSGSEIIPIRYFAGFYITGKDISAQSPKCSGIRADGTAWSEDPHPLYGSSYKPQLDDGDVWGYWVVVADYSSGGLPGTEPCDFSSQPRNCVLTLVE